MKCNQSLLAGTVVCLAIGAAYPAAAVKLSSVPLPSVAHCEMLKRTLHLTSMAEIAAMGLLETATQADDIEEVWRLRRVVYGRGKAKMRAEQEFYARCPDNPAFVLGREPAISR
jgi:cobalamin biosynthesis protein CobD/CbiB